MKFAVSCMDLWGTSGAQQSSSPFKAHHKDAFRAHFVGLPCPHLQEVKAWGLAPGFWEPRGSCQGATEYKAAGPPSAEVFPPCSTHLWQGAEHPSYRGSRIRASPAPSVSAGEGRAQNPSKPWGKEQGLLLSWPGDVTAKCWLNDHTTKSEKR